MPLIDIDDPVRDEVPPYRAMVEARLYSALKCRGLIRLVSALFLNVSRTRTSRCVRKVVTFPPGMAPIPTRMHDMWALAVLKMGFEEPRVGALHAPVVQRLAVPRVDSPGAGAGVGHVWGAPKTLNPAGVSPPLLSHSLPSPSTL